MSKTQARSSNGVTINPYAIHALQGDFAGQLITPSDPDYATARKVWNAHIDKYPALIARCTGTTDVVQMVNFTRENKLAVSVRSGGHNVAGRAVCDDGVVIDLSLMKGVIVNPQQRTVHVRAGARLGELDRETHAYGLAVPAGTYPDTGIAGLTLGGGAGWLTRKYGFTVDSLLSAEVVLADGSVVTANETTNPDLFWGLRGGGGNFGIVTSFQFRAHPVSTILGGLLIYPRTDAKALLRHYREFMATAPDEVTAYAGLISTPDGQPAAGVVVCYTGDLTEGERVLKPLRAFGKPVLDAIQPMPFPVMQKLLTDSFPQNSYHYWKSSFFNALTDDAFDIMIDYANRAPSPLSGIIIECYAGAASRVGPSDTALSLRGAGYEYNVGYLAQWSEESASDKNIAWARDVWSALQPLSNGRYELNFSSDTGEDANRAMYGDHYPRLLELKAKYDPTNFFNLNRNALPGARR